jgi:hypothetical protein
MRTYGLVTGEMLALPECRGNVDERRNREIDKATDWWPMGNKELARREALQNALHCTVSARRSEFGSGDSS